MGFFLQNIFVYPGNPFEACGIQISIAMEIYTKLMKYIFYFWVTCGSFLVITIKALFEIKETSWEYI
jgi:hypothetical protein